MKEVNIWKLRTTKDKKNLSHASGAKKCKYLQKNKTKIPI